MSLISKDIRQQILRLCISVPEIVNDDKWLIAEIWRLNGWSYDKNLYENLKAMPSAETIRRTRQKLHQDGLIEYSGATEERRYEAYKEVTDELGTPIPFFEEDPLDKLPKIKGTGRKETVVIRS